MVLRSQRTRCLSARVSYHEGTPQMAKARAKITPRRQSGKKLDLIREKGAAGEVGGLKAVQDSTPKDLLESFKLAQQYRDPRLDRLVVTR